MSKKAEVSDIIKMNLVIMRNQFFIMGALITLLKQKCKNKQLVANLEMAAEASALQLIEWRHKHGVDINTLENYTH